MVVETVVVESGQEPPTRWKFYILNALGQKVFYKTDDRKAAQAAVDEDYGQGKYTIRCDKLGAKPEKLTCRGVATRKGQKKYN